MKNLFSALALLFFAAQIEAQNAAPTTIPVGNYVGSFKQINSTNGNKSASNTIKINATTFTEGQKVGTIRYSTGCTADLVYQSNDGAGTFTLTETPTKSTDAGCSCDGEVKVKLNARGELEFVHSIGDMMVKGVLKSNTSSAPGGRRG